MSEVTSVTPASQSSQTNNTQQAPQVSQTNNTSLNQVAAANNNQSNLAASSVTFSQALSGINRANSVNPANEIANTSPIPTAPPEFHEAREKWKQHLENGGDATYERTYHSQSGDKQSYLITEDKNGISNVVDLQTGKEIDPNSKEFAKFQSMTEKFDRL